MKKIEFNGDMYEVIRPPGIWRIENNGNSIEIKSDCSYNEFLEYLKNLEKTQEGVGK